MHHYIANVPGGTVVSPVTFEEQCRVLAEHGWFGVSLAAAEAWLLRGEPLPPKSFLLTFDDGYLDNYVNAWPILHKYGHKAVIFAVADRLENNTESATRPTLADVWNGSCGLGDLPPVDHPMQTKPGGYATRQDLFLNWDEARKMEQSSSISIAAHSMSHQGIFAGPEFSDFYRPGEQKRTFYHTWPALSWGLPKFKIVPEFSGPAFLPSQELIQTVQNIVPQEENAAHAFFQEPGNVEELSAAVAALQKRQGSLGVMETPEQARQRFAVGLAQNKAVLRSELGHDVQSFCWPWGKWCQAALDAAREAGFSVFYRMEPPGINRPGGAPKSPTSGPCGNPLDVKRFKVKNKNGNWLLNRLRLYSSPLLGQLYSRIRI
jgi:peptidoglycan/xylan/chitin deacetylase (PgdA/CDA1 family)